MAKNIWFKAKKYGWGWYPSTWQGWFIVGIYVIFISVIAFIPPHLGYFFLFGPFATVTLLILCFKKGEKLKWRWGNKK